ncbi:unnamed protein product [Closterium sp. NIES-54]
MFGIDFSAWVPSPPPEHAFSGTAAVVVSLVCTVLAVFLSVRHIVMHLRNYTEPTYQRYIVRIIFMVPVRAVVTFNLQSRSLPPLPNPMPPPLCPHLPFSLPSQQLRSVGDLQLPLILPLLGGRTGRRGVLTRSSPPSPLPTPPPHPPSPHLLPTPPPHTSSPLVPSPSPLNSYEAWVIYNFLSLCLSWVGGPGAVATINPESHSLLPPPLPSPLSV